MMKNHAENMAMVDDQVIWYNIEYELDCKRLKVHIF